MATNHENTFKYMGIGAGALGGLGIVYLLKEPLGDLIESVSVLIRKCMRGKFSFRSFGFEFSTESTVAQTKANEALEKTSQ